MNRLVYILFVLLLTSCSDPEVAPKRNYDSRTGVELIFSVEGNIFPDQWYSNEINAFAAPLDYTEHERSEMIMKQALEQYPVSIVKANLKRLYVLKYIEFYGVSYGGTNSSNAVYLANNGINSGYTDIFIKQAFHHEISSILLRNYNNHFDKDQWEAINPKSFQYGSGGVDELKAGLSSQVFQDSLNALGFLNEYSMSSLENDYNNFAQNFFEPSDEFQELLLEYEPLHRKAQLFKKFYQKIDPQFATSFKTMLPL